ncbi:LysE family translocator [Streptomyces sp. 796.1]|uniref:LysE family translocator n=1 Tax=Streptomyces sp. 796.1 TaxID=3163029 RepID=UPI0039C93199
MTELLAVAAITVLAVISPGADFAMIVRNSYLYGRIYGLLSAAGVALGVLVHVTYTMLGASLLVSRSPQLFTVIKLCGAGYLVYLGYRTFTARVTADVDAEQGPRTSRLDALRTGFLTNAFNPKTMLFVLSVFTQVVGPDTGVPQRIGYGLFMSLIHGVWFGLAALCFSNRRLRAVMLRSQAILNRLLGSALICLGVALVAW